MSEPENYSANITDLSRYEPVVYEEDNNEDGWLTMESAVNGGWVRYEQAQAALAQWEARYEQLAAAILPDAEKRNGWTTDQLAILASAHRQDSETMDESDDGSNAYGDGSDPDRPRLIRKAREAQWEARWAALEQFVSAAKAEYAKTHFDGRTPYLYGRSDGAGAVQAEMQRLAGAQETR